MTFFKGTKTSGKEAQDSYAKGGTKIGMVGAGAAAGAAIGSVVPVIGTGVGALVGAGIGGLGALGIGDKIGQAISDALDEGGWLNNMGQAISGFFTETLPAKWTEFWDGVGSFFTETVPYAIGYAAGKAATFFTETLPTKWTEFWTGVGDFITQTIPEWWGNLTSTVATFFTETIPNAWSNFWGGVWDGISGFSGGVWDTVTGAFSAGYSDATGKHAEGGIMNAPHMAQVAEDGPEAIVPLGASSRSRGISVWEEAGDILGVGNRPQVGSNDNGLGDIFSGGSWGSYGGSQDGGNGDDVHVYSTSTPGSTGPAEASQDAPLHFAPIEMTGFLRSVQLSFLLEKAENCYRKICLGSHFRHRFLIKPVSFPVHRVPQTGQATCMPASDGVAAHYRKGYTRLHSFGNPLQMNSLVCMLPLF